MLPLATYRLQFRNGMNFDRARSLIPHLKNLGISHLYCSPIFSATSGSTHGYDVVDCNTIDQNLGGRAGFDRLCAELTAAGLSVMLDIVPNHMAASPENGWWRSVIEWGERSPFGGHFDIDWQSKLVLPVLQDSYAESVNEGTVVLMRPGNAGYLALVHAGLAYPIHPVSYEFVFRGFDDPVGDQLVQAAREADPLSSESFHDKITQILAPSSSCRRIDAFLTRFSRNAAQMITLHEMQPWRLLSWKEAAFHLNYRRFFDIDGLVGLRVEEPAVFEDVHRLTFELVASGQVDGLRIDHIDGLADPCQYLSRLRQRIGGMRYLVVEKILQAGERLPSDWPVNGTTGYEFISASGGAFVDRKGWDVLGKAYADRSGGSIDLKHEEEVAKRKVLQENFGRELHYLSRLAEQLLGPDASSGDLKTALMDLIVAFPVYRTYGTKIGMSPNDVSLLGLVLRDAKEQSDRSFSSLLEALVGVLDGSTAKRDDTVWALRRKFQQLTGPVMAKAVEDTLFYRYNHFLPLNEVGGEMVPKADAIDEFHRLMSRRAQTGDHSLSATATHDTKRGEDARALLYALSEAPDIWLAAVERWSAMNRQWRIHDDGHQLQPDASTEWLIYQALAGVWPSVDLGKPDATADLTSRFLPYLEKAMREAKTHTSWRQVNTAYEDRIKRFLSGILSPANTNFLDDFASTIEPFRRAGVVKSLSATLLKLVAPGIPDFYQGAENGDFSLVDPDNRRQIALDQPDEMGKQALIATVLRLRNHCRAVFETGTYTPIRISGEGSSRFLAFMREKNTMVTICVATMISQCFIREKRSNEPVLEMPSRILSRTFKDAFSGRAVRLTRHMPVWDMMQESTFTLIYADGEKN
ncbi:(1-_4)-alpha-D-glucan 1-alpha-D-glucosylmutase [Phyllobacterium ifriqiyense]|uniref:(1->4)-alpha-D-glucan 1-alpha-D-glucosylmutase n=1 Tax=Phyllobacterium ifriqiyense TaxID=314238 RepID=A0ABU0S374_9HYPH|nr:malto-oligosyltrehalose synthase [Phyllobacterium ifriqiyense]MDQ0995209.1 (1->4)-alpha-D-glucan 1-alpha-D-glucosylmutase [Phyllobacterium ifriqiyense]